MDQMEARVDICTQNLKMWKNGGQKLIDCITTEDEVYVYYYDALTRQESRVWIIEGEDVPQVVKRDRTVRKVLYAVFFSTSGLSRCVKLEGQKSVTANWFTTVCLPQVFGHRSGRPRMLHMDNATSHTSNTTKEYLAKNKIKTVPHPPYSPDLALCDFWLFAGLKRNLRGRSFASERELDSAARAYFEDIPSEAWKGAFNMWRKRMERCIEANGQYFK